jgi:hypothetical protein
MIPKDKQINFYAIRDQTVANPAYQYGMDLIKQGDWEYGFYLHELRSLPDLRYPQGVKTDFVKTPIWIPGMNCKGKNAIVWSEAGWGDMLQFSRFIPLLKDAGIKTVKLLFPDSMTRILKRLPNHDGLFLPQESFPGAVKIKAMSLLYFLIEHRVIPAKPVEKMYGSEGIFRNPEIIKPNRDKPLIGYCYTTLNNSWNIKMKQIPKELVDNFIKQHPEFDWVSLQQGDGFIESNRWSNTADQLQTLDGVISVDSAIAHCAGSVGVPVANLVGQEQLACWRWYPKGNTTCWYDSMKTIWFNTWTEGLEEAVKHFKVEKKKKQTKTKKEVA